MYTIRVATDEDKNSWETVSKLIEPESHYFSWNWRDIIRSTFKHIPYYLIIEDSSGSIIGLCPMFFVKSILFGSALISVPYINGGGIFLKDHNAIGTILKYIENLQSELNCEYSELRNREPISEDSSLTLKTHKVSMRLPLDPDPEKLFASFAPKLRSQIRRPTKEGCTSVVANGNNASHKLINDFYSAFSQNMKSLGTPVYSKKLFSKSLYAFGKNSTIAVIYNQSEPVACGITIRSGNTVEIPWAASLRSKSHYAPNMLLYWELLKHSCLSNVAIFDFGRSTKDAGTYKFKAQWGATPSNLYWYYPKNSKTIPDVNPHNKKFELLVSIWKQMPLSLTKIIGPTITKSLP